MKLNKNLTSKLESSARVVSPDATRGASRRRRPKPPPQILQEAAAVVTGRLGAVTAAAGGRAKRRLLALPPSPSSSPPLLLFPLFDSVLQAAGIVLLQQILEHRCRICKSRVLLVRIHSRRRPFPACTLGSAGGDAVLAGRRDSCGTADFHARRCGSLPWRADSLGGRYSPWWTTRGRPAPFP